MRNRYPGGRLNEEDEGVLPIAILIEDKRIIIDFSKEIRWIGFDKDKARELANVLLSKADEIDNLVQ